MENDQVVNAESTPAQEAPAPEVEEIPLEQFTDEQRSKWLETGEVPTRPKEGSAPQDSQSAGKPENSAPDSEPGKQESQQQGEKPRHNADTRKQRLAREIDEQLAERRRLVEENEALRRQNAHLKGEKPDTAPRQDAQPKKLERPTKPKAEDFETWDKFEEANDKYHEDLADFIAAQRIESEREAYAQQQRERQVAETNRTRLENWQKRTREARKRHEDFDAVVGTAIALPLNPVMDQMILHSEIGPDLVYYLSQTPGVAEHIAGLDAYGTARAIARLEDKLSTQLKTPPPKTISDAKKPPTELAGTNAAPPDEIAAALQAGDFEKYARLKNAQEAAARR